MAENGPFGIYTIKPLYDSSPLIDLPTCMYKMKTIYEGTAETSRATAVQDETVHLAEVEEHQLKLLEKLENLKSQVLELKQELNITKSNSVAESSSVEMPKTMQSQDIVIKGNPKYPPYSLWVFRHLLSDILKVQLVTYVHSSLDTLPDTVRRLQAQKDTAPYDLTLTVIWKQTDGKDPEMMIDPIHQGVIEGEVNIARYLSRLLPSGYEQDPFVAMEIDHWLELAHSSLIHGSPKEQSSLFKSMNSELGKNNYLVGNILSIADIVLWSMISQVNCSNNLPSNVEKWWKNLNASIAFQIPVAV